MRTSRNKNLESAFVTDSKQDDLSLRKIERVQQSSNLLTKKYEAKASLLLDQYKKSGLNKTESFAPHLEEEERSLNHRAYFFRGVVAEKPREFRIQSGRKIANCSRPVSSLLSLEFLPHSTKSKSTLSSLTNLDHNHESSNSENPPSLNFQGKIKNFLGRLNKDTSFDQNLQNFDNSIQKYKQQHESNINLSYKTLNTTQENSLDEEISSLQSLNLKKFLKNKIQAKPPNQPQPQKKLDKILSQVTFIGNHHSIKSPEKPTPLSLTDINENKCSVRKTIKIVHPVKIKNPSEEDLKKLSVREMNDKLKGFSQTVSQQITSYRSLRLYSKISMNTEMRNNLKALESEAKPKKTSTKRMEELKKTFIQEIFRIVKKMKILGLEIEEIIKSKVFSQKPFEKEGSVEFFKAVKSGDYEAVSDLLILNKYLVYDFDSADKTALHWAVERNRPKITKLLLENGADPDARDMIGRTPLFLAAKTGHIVCAKILLMFKANPLIRSDGKKTALEYASNFELKRVLEAAGKIHAVMSGFTWKKFQKMWDYLDKRDFEIKERELI